MLNLDAIMLQTIEVTIFEQVVHVKQPSVIIWEKINAAEKDLNANNLMKKRAEVAKILLDNNEENKVFDLGDVKKLSRKAIDTFIAAVTAASIQAEKDPN